MVCDERALSEMLERARCEQRKRVDWITPRLVASTQINSQDIVPERLSPMPKLISGKQLEVTLKAFNSFTSFSGLAILLLLSAKIEPRNFGFLILGRPLKEHI